MVFLARSNARTLTPGPPALAVFAGLRVKF
jgi:hypothetical protein